MDITLWLGSQQSYDRYLAQEESLKLALASGSFSSPDDNDEDDAPDPENFTLFGNVGVVDITGSLTNDDAWYNSWLGRTSYNQVRRGVIEAATHPAIAGGAGAVVLNIDSGGGMVNGVDDTANLIREVASSGVPVYTHSGGTLCSAAMWLGAAATKVYAGSTAEVGSVSVLGIHTDVTKALKDAGIKKTVMRTGDEKALGNPFEALSDKAREREMANMRAIHEVFVSRIADFRGYTAEKIQDTVGNGRVFIGQEAVAVGLVDGIMTLDELISTLQSKIDRNAKGKETNPMAKTKPTVLTASARDLMLDGVAADDAAKLAAEVSASEPDPVPAEPEGTEVAAAADPDPVPAVQAQADSGVVEFLRTELKASQAEVVALNAKLAAAESKVASLEAVHGPMKALLETSYHRLQTHLGQPHVDVSDIPAETLLVMHGKAHKVFCEKFPVGGVAAVQVEDDKPISNVAAVDPARLRACKI